MPPDSPTPALHPLCRLAREDQDLILELVLRSGSLKEVAEAYDVSYPTLRLRLDRLIERLRAAMSGERPDPLRELLADLVERGELSGPNARAIRDLARKAAEMAAARADSIEIPESASDAPHEAPGLRGRGAAQTGPTADPAQIARAPDADRAARGVGAAGQSQPSQSQPSHSQPAPSQPSQHRPPPPSRGPGARRPS